MASIKVQDLISAGVHFGHRTSRWNPKMAPYIHGKRNRIHILDLVETIKGLSRATHFLRQLCATGRSVVVVGTKRQIKNVVQQEASRAGMPYVNERWLGGTLTNFSTIRSRLKRLEELEELDSSGALANYKKKEQSSLGRERRRILKNLDGIRTLDRVPGAMIVIDPKKEYIAVREANRLQIPIVAILDTDCDPDHIDIAIPANDDAMKSVAYVLSRLSDAILEGKSNISEESILAEPAEQVIEMKKRDRPQGQRRPQQRRGGPGGGPGAGGGAGPGGRGRDRGEGAPAGDAPAAETPAAQAPVAETPAAPAAETPAADAPAGGETPAS